MEALREALFQAYEAARGVVHQGKVATYIPELARANPARLGAAVVTPAGSLIEVGETHPPFTLQSVAKVLSLALALAHCGPDAVFARVGMEPTGEPFNSLVNVETAEAKPLNPMINSGALAVCALLVEAMGHDAAWDALLALARELCRPEPVSFSERVYASEKETAYRNRALAYLLKELGIIRGAPEEALELYVRICALEVTCAGLARMAFRFAHPLSISQATGIPAEVIRIVNTFLVTCGMYNASGEFAIKAGIPAKSGVSGAIMAVVPGRMGIGVIGPALDRRGNSIGGTHLLTALSHRLELSIFGPPPLTRQ